MKKLLVALFAVSAFAAAASAQDWSKARLEKSPRHLEYVKVSHDHREVNSFIAYPEVKGKATAIVVIHEIFGLSDWARSVTDEFAEQGYIAIAPDLLSGFGPNGGGSESLGTADDIRKVIPKLPPDQITADLNAVVNYVSKLPACNGKVVVVGFCWGGGQAFRFATNRSDLKAVFVCYGTGPTDAADIAKINCPVYGFYAGNDARVTSTVAQSTQLMQSAGKKYIPTVYDGAGHGFMRQGEDMVNGHEPDKKAKDQVWQRWLEILKTI